MEYDDFYSYNYRGKKIPYYMACQMDTRTLNHMDNERDMRYLKEMYPKTMRDIQRIIDDECDRLEYDGSFMFDEYPDKTEMQRLRDKIYYEVNSDNITTESVDATSNFGGPGPVRPPRPPRPPHPGKPGPGMPPPPPPQGKNRWMSDLIETLLYNEFYNRRCRRRNCRRFY